MFDTVSLIESAAKAAGADARLATDDELFDAVLGFEQARRRLDAAEAHALAELEARGSADMAFGLHTAQWLAREGRLPRAAARNRVKVANELRSHLDEVDEQLTDGRVGVAHARILSGAVRNPRVGLQIAAMQSDLLAEAQVLAFEPWARQVNTIVELLDQDGGHRPDDHPRDRLWFEDAYDGSTRLLAILTGDDAAIVRHAIDTRADRLFRQYSEDHTRCPDIEIPSRGELMAMALAELLREALGVDVSSTRAPKTDVTLVVNAADPTHASTPDGVRLADETTRLLCCDAVFTPVVVDNLGVPLDMGREARLATDAQRRAAGLRDGGCAFPGCTAPHTWVDMHHITLWINGGLTNLDDLLSLCRRHHRVVHRTGWAVHATDDGHFWIQSPTGRTFWCQRHGRTPPGPPPPAPPGPQPPPRPSG